MRKQSEKQEEQTKRELPQHEDPSSLTDMITDKNSNTNEEPAHEHTSNDPLELVVQLSARAGHPK